MGDKFGQSIVNANAILDDVNPRMPQIRHDIQQLAALGDTYADAAPDLFDSLNNAVITARTLHRQEADLDAALLAATGLGNTGEDIFRKGGPYLQRGIADLLPTAQLLDTYSPEIFCTIRNYYDTEPMAAATVGTGNGYALRTMTELMSGLGGILTLPGLVGAARLNGTARTRRTGRRSAESLCLSRQSAAGERPRRAGGCAGLLATHYP